jgi:predicted negative regulator of RcsB-dependent stress response
MKIDLNYKTFAFVFAVGLAILFGIKYLQEKNNSNASNKQLEEFIKAKAEEFRKEKEGYRLDSVKHVAKIDSAMRVFVALEAKRKADNTYYQNKLNALKTINTYTARQRYSDSLTRSILR